MHKTQQHNPVVDMVQCQLDATIQLADVVFSGTEKIDRAVLDVTHQTVDSQLKLVRAIAKMRDPSKMADLQQVMAHQPEKPCTASSKSCPRWSKCKLSSVDLFVNTWIL